MKKLLSVALLGISIAISGCGSSGPNTYASVVDLKAAFEDAGGSCLEWNQDDAITAALESGNCNSRTVLSIYSDAIAAETAATDLADLIRSFQMTPNIAYGPNWVINSDQAVEVAAKLGGTLITE